MALSPPAPNGTIMSTTAVANSLQAIDRKPPANTSNKRFRTIPNVTTQVQDTVETNNLSKYVLRDSNWLTELGWEQVVRSRTQRGDFGHLRICPILAMVPVL
jgi:hypothetical protein